MYPLVAVAPVLIEHEREGEEDDADELVEEYLEEETEDAVVLFLTTEKEDANATYGEENANADDRNCLFHLSVVLFVEHGGILACSTYRSINRQKQPLSRLADCLHDAQMEFVLLIGVDAKFGERLFLCHGAAPTVEIVVDCLFVGVVGTLVVAELLAEG